MGAGDNAKKGEIMGVTWSPTHKSGDITLSGSNLVSANNGTGTFWGTGLAGGGKQFGKWYWEVTIDDEGGHSSGCQVGVALAAHDFEEALAAEPYGWCYVNDGEKGHGDSKVGFGGAYTDAAVIGIALDLDAGLIWFSLDDVWQDSGDPAAGSGEAYADMNGLGPMFPAWSGFKDADLQQVTANFGATAFAGTQPAGFLAFDVVTPTVKPSGQREFTTRSAWRHKNR
jgi:hypothetical protein